MANETYTVVKTDEVLDTSDVSNPQQAVRITWKSKATGATGTVTLPAANLTAADVDRAVSEAVALRDAIHEL